MGRELLASETAMATADYLALVEDARRGQIAMAWLRRLKEAYAFEPCERGCGEMGVCHRDLRPDVRELAAQILEAP